MKILHLSTYDMFGGAAIAAKRIHEALLSQGFNSHMLVRYAEFNFEKTEPFVASKDFKSKALRSLKRKQIKYYNRINRKADTASLDIHGPLTDCRADLLTHFNQLPFTPDIIHIHKVENFVDLSLFIQSVPQHIPIVITLHDLSPMSGGCDYPGDCENFSSNCGHCPIIKSNKCNDYSRKIHTLKKHAYQSRAQKRLGFIANSHWTEKQACHASMYEQQTIETIHYPINTDIFNTTGRQQAKEALGISPDRKVILFGATYVNNLRKGATHIENALNSFSDPSILTLSFGKGNIKLHKNEHINIGSLNNERLLSVLYKSADVFIMTSIEEAFGLTALEAASCGSTVAAFNSGGIPDTVKDNLNGRLAPRENAAALTTAIKELLENQAFRESWIQQATDWVDARFSEKIIAQKHFNFYKKLLDTP